MRVPRAQTIAEIARRARLPIEEVRRYNPSLSRRVPADGTLYLPKYIPALGRDVAYWHRPPSRQYGDVLDEFLRLNLTPDEWDSPTFDGVLERFRTRFASTRTEEGTVMATMLPSAVTTCADTSLSQLRPCLRRRWPIPPERVSPAIPVSVTTPSGVASPCR